MKKVVMGGVGILLLFLTFGVYQKSNLINSMLGHKTYSQPQATSTEHIPASDHSHKDDSHNGPTDNTHLGQMSAEMKQSLKDTLLFNAPIETINRSDGSVIMKKNGRVTHMPVAVQMPDGSIQVKEYSYIPDDK